MAGGGSTIQEFVVKLGTQIDNSGFQQMLSLLDSNKLKALGVTAALSAATTAVYKFAESVTKEEFRLRELSKTRGKSIEELRAQETALKAMGKTLQDINKDQDLKKIYNDINETNKALALPNLEGTLQNVRGLQGAFWKLRSIANYAIEWIGTKLLVNLEAPIKRITDKINELSGWLRDNLHSISTKVASYITGFSKGIIGIAEGFETIVGWVSDLPDGIKSIGTAVTVLWALVKSGPIGQILAVVTAIGDVIHDYEVYQWNQAHPDLEPVAVAYESLWERLSGGDVGGLFEELLTGMTKTLDKLSEVMDNFSFDDMLKDPETQIGGLIKNVTDWIDTHQEQFKALGGAFLNAIGSTFSAEGGLIVNLASDLVTGLGNFFRVNDGQLNGIFKDNSMAEGVAAGLVNSLLGMDPIAAIGSGILATMDSSRDKLREEYRRRMEQGWSGVADLSEEEYVSQNLWKSLGSGAVDFGADLITLITTGIKGVENIGGKIFGAVADAIGQDNAAGRIFGTLSNGSEIGSALVDGLLAGISTGNFLLGLAGFFGRVTAALGQEGGAAELTSEIHELGANFADMLFGELDESTQTRSGGIFSAIGEVLKGIWTEISPYLDPLWDNVRTFVENIAKNLWSWISPHMETLGANLREWLNTFVDDIYANGNGVVKAAMEAAGYTKRNFLKQNDNGSYTLTDSTGNTYSGPMATEYTEDAMGFLERMLPYLTINNSGNFDESSSKNGISPFIAIQGIKEGFTTLNEITREVLRSGRMPTDAQGNSFSWDTIASAYNGTSNSWSNGKLPLTVDVKTKLDNDIQEQLKKKKYSIDINGNITYLAGEVPYTVGSGDDSDGDDSDGGGGAASGFAYGGRISRREDNLTVGEDGTEYIIPITKPERAFNLLMQMFGEMGTGMLSRIIDGLGMGQSGTVGGSLGSIASAVQGMTINNTYNISAPVTMYIQSSASAEDVGKTAYSMAERHLISTLRGAYA